MSREQLIRLIRDAENDAGLRAALRRAYASGRRWAGLLEQAHASGYAVNAADLAEARAADRAGAFLQRSRMAAIRPLWGSAPVLPDQGAASAARRPLSTAR
ncbi:MAG: hypothetical protein ACOVNL_14000 [Prochlorococcaceae cyanobacterium]|jgi:hypothetical protein